MFCWDANSCQERFVQHRYWMSSTAKPWSTNFAQGGIFATDGTSPWGAANRICACLPCGLWQRPLTRP